MSDTADTAAAKIASRDGPPAGLPLRLYRTSRVLIHLLEAMATAATVLPWVDSRRRSALIRRWSRRLLRMLNVECRVRGAPQRELTGNLLIVANHISWLDIFVLNTLQPARFIAKAELRRWPVVGILIAGVGTLFIERDRRRDTHRVNRHVAGVLASGEVIAIFPEGTTTDGLDVLPFHASLLQPIVDADGHVQPIAIRYRTVDGEHSDAAAYAGDTGFLESFWRVVGTRSLVVELHVAPPVPAGQRHRRELSHLAERAIRGALAAPVIGSEPGRRGRHPA